VEVEQIRERTLGELLAATGYVVEPDDEDPRDTAVMLSDIRRRLSQDVGHIRPAVEDDEHSTTDASIPPQSTPQESEPDSFTYRDPTLPQFRPNTVLPTSPELISIHGEMPPRPTNDFIPLRQAERERLRPMPVIAPSPEPGAEPTDEDDEEEEEEEEEQEEKMPVDKDGLMKERAYHLWKCDKAEEEAEMRGGFGRLNFKEFDERVKRAINREGRGSQMDYLGSWIEFCIP